MLEDAINTIVDIMDAFPGVYKISVIEKNDIHLHWCDEEFHEEEFTNSVELLEWCEKKFNGEAENRTE
ncbi:hypothetical protein MG296_10655 [Flavobacteriaceae bacterium TK19130]|nr:hypothetical protein [Thermobacterium salinum]